MNATNLQHFPTIESGQSGIAQRASKYLQSLAKACQVWRRRSQTRRPLKALSDHQLREIGVRRAEAVVEADKPFWRI
jgi:uncharacterized protein YjiS (DUF1127 family)